MSENINKTIINERKNLNYSVREAFKALRTNFLFCGSDYKTVLITSCVKNEGKSTISIELSKSLALANKRVLLIDADLRKSVFASKYTTNTGEVVGLSEYLSGQTTYEKILYSTQNKNLDVIFSGAVPPTPVELLGSAIFTELIKRVREEYDYVIIDAAPLGAVIDASVISAVCDGALLVITANYIAQRFAKDVKEQIEKSGCKVLGAILNRIPIKSGSYYNRYYKRYYGNYKKYSHTTGYEDTDSDPNFASEEPVSHPVTEEQNEAPVVETPVETPADTVATPSEKREPKSTPSNVPVKNYPQSKPKKKKKK